MPAGWRVYYTEPSSSTTASASAVASDPKCAPLLNEVKDPPRPLPSDQAEVEFDGGDGFKPPYIVENLHAYPSAAAAAADLAAQKQAVAACSRILYTLDGRTSPVKVAAERAPSLLVPATGVRFTAQGGDLSGYDARIVTAQVGDVLVSLTFLSETEAQRNDISTSAVVKVEKVLGTKH